MEDDKLNEFAEKTQKDIINDLKKIYSQKVIDHWINPKNWGIMNEADGYGKITGPCGDTMEFSIKVKDNVITHCTFDTDGCGTTIACASIATELVIGLTLNEARLIDQAFMLDNCGGLPDESKHCALLAADTLQRTIDDAVSHKSQPWKKFYRGPK